MIYRSHVAVLRATPHKERDLTESQITWNDAVAYTLGINAVDAADAIGLAVAAARSAVDRRGHFIGGVVAEASCRCVDPKEFDGYRTYFHAPMDKRGIFYVSGVTYYAVSKLITVGATAELEHVKAAILRAGLPAPSFIHPQLRVEPPSRMRLLCSQCAHWVEVDDRGLLYSLMDGLHNFWPEEQEVRNAASVAGPFVQRHLSECAAGILCIYESDDRWSTLDEMKRDDA